MFKHITGNLLFLLFIGTGCRLGPSYEPPEVYVPEEWKAQAVKQQCTPCVVEWWDVFDDSILAGLECQAVENSPTLGQALAKVIEARSFVEINGAALYPQITLNPLYNDSGQLFKLYLPQGVISAPNPNLSVFRIHQYQYALPLNVNYEVDLWGRLRNQYDAAIYAAQAQDEDYINVMLTLTTDVANNYYQVRLIDLQIEILEATLAERKRSLSLNQGRYQKGIGNAIDVSSASIEVSNIESSLYDAQRQRALVENVLAVLLGVAPSEFCLAPMPLKGLPPAVPAGAPSDILERRPDLIEAERQCAAKNALVGAAYANFFPSISLTGALGYSSPDLRQFLRWISRYWSIGATGAQTIFDGGYDEGNFIQAQANFMEASYLYQQTVLTAFREVEDALNNLEAQAKQFDSLAAAADAAESRYRLSTQRFLSGLVNYLEVINYEDAALSANLSLANIQGQRYLSTIQLIKALGGSWTVCE